MALKKIAVFLIHHHKRPHYHNDSLLWNPKMALPRLHDFRIFKDYNVLKAFLSFKISLKTFRTNLPMYYYNFHVIWMDNLQKWEVTLYETLCLVFSWLSFTWASVNSCYWLLPTTVFSLLFPKLQSFQSFLYIHTVFYTCDLLASLQLQGVDLNSE